jgi:hypothetical protein
LLSHIVPDLTRDAERRDPNVNVVQWSDFWRVADGARARDVHLHARISRRAMKTYVNMQTKAGKAVLDGGVLRLTDAGLKVRDSAGAGSWGSVPRRRGQVRPLASGRTPLAEPSLRADSS